MPYILPSWRELFDPLLNNLGPLVESPGELNYCITKLCLAYLAGCEKINYTRVAEIHGVLDTVGREFYRRVVVPYENDRKNENGDVY